MRIILIRHAESQGNAEPLIHRAVADHAIPLSPRGLKQASKVGELLRKFFDKKPPDSPYRIWTSPYNRTRQTAANIADQLGNHVLDIRENVLLCEQQFGLFDGLKPEEIAKSYPLEHDFYEKQVRFEGKFWARMPLGESRFDVSARVHQTFGTFHRDFDRHNIRNLIVICHGVTLRAFVMMWCHKSPEWFEEEPNPSNCAIRLIDQGIDRGYLFKGFPRSPGSAELDVEDLPSG